MSKERRGRLEEALKSRRPPVTAGCRACNLPKVKALIDELVAMLNKLGIAKGYVKSSLYRVYKDEATDADGLWLPDLQIGQRNFVKCLDTCRKGWNK